MYSVVNKAMRNLQILSSFEYTNTTTAIRNIPIEISHFFKDKFVFFILNHLFEQVNLEGPEKTVINTDVCNINDKL